LPRKLREEKIYRALLSGRQASRHSAVPTTAPRGGIRQDAAAPRARQIASAPFIRRLPAFRPRNCWRPRASNPRACRKDNATRVRRALAANWPPLWATPCFRSGRHRSRFCPTIERAAGELARSPWMHWFGDRARIGILRAYVQAHARDRRPIDHDNRRLQNSLRPSSLYAR